MISPVLSRILARLGYKLVGHLASGGQAEVLQVKMDGSAHLFALKLAVGDARATSFANVRHRLEQEYAVLSKLSSLPSKKDRELFVFPIDFHQGELDGLVYVGLLFPYLECEDLDHLLVERRKAPLPWADLRHVIGRVARALEIIHDRQYVHRDLKPANILLVPPGTAQTGAGVRLIDFGIVRRPRHVGDLHRTSQDAFLGSPYWCAPEMFPKLVRDIVAPELTDAQIGPASDVFSLGATLLFALTLQYHRAGMAALGQQMRLDDFFRSVVTGPPNVTQLDRSVPSEIVELIAGSLAVRAQDRPSLDDFTRALHLRQKGSTDMAHIADIYSRPITGANPSCIIILVDQSGSMREFFGGGRRKSEVVDGVVNDYIDNLVSDCYLPGGTGNYYHVGVFGYTELGGQVEVHSLLNADVPLVPISVLDGIAQHVRQESEFEPGVFIRKPVWVTSSPPEHARTPMCAAFEHVAELVTAWVEDHPEAHPAVIFHISDGDWTDANPMPVVKRLFALPVPPLVFNCHITADRRPSVVFPSQCPALSDTDSANVLWDMSSELPPVALDRLRRLGPEATVDAGARCYLANVTKASQIQLMFKIGTPVR